VITFSLLELEKCQDAHRWQREFVKGNDLVFPRTLEDYEKLAGEGQIWCARDDKGEFLGITYFKEDQSYCLKSKAWEIGGLIVAPTAEGKGIGRTLVHLALGHVLWVYDPLARKIPVIAHVHEANNPGPRPIFKSLEFELVCPVKVPGKLLPGLRTNAEGFVVGDEFILRKPETLRALAKWCKAWKGQTVGKKGSYNANVVWTLNASMENWANAFEVMASR